MNARRRLWWCLSVLAVSGLFAAPWPARTGEDKLGPDAKEVQAVLDKAIDYLRTSQGKDGSYSPKLAGPGITALVVAALIRNGVSPNEPVVARGLQYLEGQVQKDGGVYSKGLANYTTSVAVMAFTEANKGGKYDKVIQDAGTFLKGIQKETPGKDPAFGGFGYDATKRPDLSNTNFTVEALLAAGVPKDDPAIQKALKFISRCQNLPGEFNDQPFARKAGKDDEGGFTYLPFDEDEKNPYHTAEGGLRSLGGMTYGGLKSFLYAGVSKDDARVKAAIGWIRRHWTLEENPGLGNKGLYYYYHTFGKAMHSWGEDRFADDKGTRHDWRRELFTALKTRQRADGSWMNMGDRTFFEQDPNLATAFAVLSLSYTSRR
jgi:squalene-hopene/tetraprenyl-beta-curcumene cyclase